MSICLGHIGLAAMQRAKPPCEVYEKSSVDDSWCLYMLEPFEQRWIKRGISSVHECSTVAWTTSTLGIIRPWYLS